MQRNELVDTQNLIIIHETNKEVLEIYFFK